MIGYLIQSLIGIVEFFLEKVGTPIHLFTYFSSMHLKYIFTALRRLLAILLLIVLGISLLRFSQIYNEILTNTSLNPLLNGTSIAPINPQCENYNFLPIGSNVTYTRFPIYDFFIFNDEFDVLEIRLNELYQYVTLFLIAESRETLSGRVKPFYLKENWSKFAKYHNKIRRIEVNLVLNTTNPWDNEHRMRNEGLRLALSTITDKKYFLLASDADEIPKARFMNALFHCLLPDASVRFVLNCDFYYYSYEFRSKKHVYYGSTLTLIDSNPSTLLSGTQLRNDRFKYKFIPSTCFHCTWCFNQLKDVRLKMASYSHTEHNQNQFRTREHILDRYRHGKDLFDRPGEEYIYIQNNTDYPQLVQLQPERFLYMTQRSNLTNVGFIDA